MITLNNKIMIKIAVYFVVLMLTASFTISNLGSQALDCKGMLRSTS